MTWTYDVEAVGSSPKDEVRALIQDTDDTFPLLSDEEIQWLVDKWMPVYDSTEAVAAHAAAIVSRKFAGLVSVSADGVEVDVSGLSDRYTQMATDIREEYKELAATGEVDLTELMLDQDPDFSIRPLSFSMGMHDNPAAGLQDFGGWGIPAWDYYPAAW